jgi:hypothetical protein
MLGIELIGIFMLPACNYNIASLKKEKRKSLYESLYI